MQTYKGKYNSAVAYATDIEFEAINQIHRFLDHPVFSTGRIRIMPDVHAGAGAVIGFTAELGDKVIPSTIGVDIGCGIAAWKIPKLGHLHFDRFDKFVRAHVPSGFDARSEKYDWSHLAQSTVHSTFEKDVDSISGILSHSLDETLTKRDIRRERIWNSIGTLGGGNHFIELDRDQDGGIWLVIHTGSRNFGLQIATYHQKSALQQRGKMAGLEWLEGAEAQAYTVDMAVAQAYAALNRRVIAEVLLGFFDVKSLDGIEHVESVHNYIDFTDRVIRKGAIAAHKDQPVIIPLTMEHGTIIGTGLGNEEWNFSAPHGAGRVMSRRKAKETLDLDHYHDRMRKAGVWTSCVGKGTLDEAPMAYRRPTKIIEAIGPTVTVTEIMRPIYNFKAGADEQGGTPARPDDGQDIAPGQKRRKRGRDRG